MRNRGFNSHSHLCHHNVDFTRSEKRISSVNWLDIQMAKTLTQEISKTIRGMIHFEKHFRLNRRYVPCLNVRDLSEVRGLYKARDVILRRVSYL